MKEYQISIPFVKITQPIGEIYFTKMTAFDLLNVIKFDPRQYIDNKHVKGINRIIDKKRVKKIAMYLDNPDATFPTAVVLAIDFDQQNVDIKDSTININSTEVLSIVDGQHRIKSLAEKTEDFQKNFEMPVVVLPNTDEEIKAVVFSIVNGTQMKVNSSLISDLFAVTKKNNPYKAAHNVVLSLNTDAESPWYGRIKMLGRKETPDGFEIISQGSFIKYLMPLISKHPEQDLISVKKGENLAEFRDCIFRQFYLDDKIDYMIRILLNYFKAVSRVWEKEWNDTKSIINKTVGFSAFIRLLSPIFLDGMEKKDVSENYFYDIFKKVRVLLDEEGKLLYGSKYPSSGQSSNQLYKDLLNSYNRIRS